MLTNLQMENGNGIYKRNYINIYYFISNLYIKYMGISMRLVIENYGDAKILRDKSPYGITRYVVEWEDGTSQIYNAAWYNLKLVKRYVEAQLNGTI